MWDKENEYPYLVYTKWLEPVYCGGNIAEKSLNLREGLHFPHPIPSKDSACLVVVIHIGQAVCLLNLEFTIKG